jgi:hypothetical protein
VFVSNQSLNNGVKNLVQLAQSDKLDLEAVIAFEKFPESKTGKNIAKWLQQSHSKAGLKGEYIMCHTSETNGPLSGFLENSICAQQVCFYCIGKVVNSMGVIAPPSSVAGVWICVALPTRIMVPMRTSRYIGYTCTYVVGGLRPLYILRVLQWMNSLHV